MTNRVVCSQEFNFEAMKRSYFEPSNFLRVPQDHVFTIIRVGMLYIKLLAHFSLCII